MLVRCQLSESSTHSKDKVLHGSSEFGGVGLWLNARAVACNEGELWERRNDPLEQALLLLVACKPAKLRSCTGVHRLATQS